MKLNWRMWSGAQIELDTAPGAEIGECIRSAILFLLCMEHDCIVSFLHNGRKFVVDPAEVYKFISKKEKMRDERED